VKELLVITLALLAIALAVAANDAVTAVFR